MSVLDLARPELLRMQAYSSARMEASGGEIFLNANESAWPSHGKGPSFHRYPEPQPAALVDQLAALYGVTSDRLLVSRGSDEAIDLLTRAFCRAGRDAIVVMPPTFGMYAICAQIQDAAVLEAPLDNQFNVVIDTVLAAVTDAVKLVYVCSPNNPSGQRVPGETIVALADALQGRALLVVDEAYAEFSGQDQASALDLLDRYEHLVVLRTLSKAWALAGARVGALLGTPALVALLRKIIPPYPLPTPCVDAALRALSPEGRAAVSAQVDQVRSQREALAHALAHLPAVREVLPSSANFLTVRFADAAVAYRRLFDAGVVVRDVRRYRHLGDALRITVGTPDENRRVLAVLQGVSA
ncbi:histidinol-phosphate transaminase [Dyella sp.]|uniref:histidinol-phosphate transaminase n=1 Tax=Dyella sp. TaxID=1869338 RepID=UPI002ED4DCAB